MDDDLVTFTMPRAKYDRLMFLAGKLEGLIEAHGRQSRPRAVPHRTTARQPVRWIARIFGEGWLW